MQEKKKREKRLSSKVFHLDKTDYSKAYRLHSRLSGGDNETPSACHSFMEFYIAGEEWSNIHSPVSCTTYLLQCITHMHTFLLETKWDFLIKRNMLFEFI